MFNEGKQGESNSISKEDLFEQIKDYGTGGICPYNGKNCINFGTNKCERCIDNTSEDNEES